MIATHERLELRVPVPASDGSGADWEIAATVHLPATESLVDRPPVFVGMPGAGYSRQYYDLPEPGYSEAEYHVARGTVVVALDHLGVGDSSIPPLEVTTLATVAAANHAAVAEIVDRLRHGTLSAGRGPITPAAVIGAGQSMGGFILAAMQAYHRSFDGVAMLGSSMAATQLPRRPDAPEIVIPAGATPDEAAMIVLGATDWRWAFHWDDVLPSLVDADLAGGLPIRQTAPIWGSVTTPGLVNALVLPGVVAAEVAQIDVPVLLARGERDVCAPPIEELAAFTGVTDIASFVAPRMAHMHNFAGTRQQFWNRIDAFITQVATATVAAGH
jgi:alpha-beta hydrolase superfamily lysophospholipase